MILNTMPSMSIPLSPMNSCSSSIGTKRPFNADETSSVQLRQPQHQHQQKQKHQQQQQQQQQQHNSRQQSHASQGTSHTRLPPPLTTFSPPRMATAPSSGNNPPPPSNPSSSFRNVSACNRCRLRKNRCDQQLPRCQSCEKARVHCVGYDPITKREIPRSYVYFLEARITYLENLLVENQVDFRGAEAFEGELTNGAEGVPKVTGPPSASSGQSPTNDDNSNNYKSRGNGNANCFPTSIKDANGERELDGNRCGSKPFGDDLPDIHADQDQKVDHTNERLNNLVSNIGMVSVQGASDPRYQGSTSGISFARVVFAAVKSSVATGTSSERMIGRSAERLPPPSGIDESSANGSAMRDSFFGLHTRPTVKQAVFPDRELASRLVGLYFEHANPQIPILHRGEFMEMFNRVYSIDEELRSARELYILNIVFAIGAGIIFDTKSAPGKPEAEKQSGDGERERGEDEAENEENGQQNGPKPQKRQKLSSRQFQPEEYHASAIVHLERFLSWSPSTDRPDGLGGGLEELQAVLLLAGFALLRPVSPGLWYIVGVAVRLAVDLGLHYEDGTGIDSIGDGDDGNPARCPKDPRNLDDDDQENDNKDRPKVDPLERGRREFVRDLRRRLWWCVYSFDRLVSTCVGRPFGISDQAITTEFPSLLDDDYITKEGFKTPPPGEKQSYKHASYHYFRLRLLQSEIQQVLQHQQIRKARRSGKNRRNAFMHKKLSSPFLEGFDSFRSWRSDMHRRMEEWKDSAPSRLETGVQFSLEFLELNYWQAVIMLYRQCLAVPAPLAREMSPAEDVSTPSLAGTEDCDDEDNIYVKVAEAGQKVLRLYRQLHRVRLVNYTFLATHHLFMAGISFLYAIWYSPVVRSRLTLDEVDFTVLAATSVLGDLMDKCPPAEACRDAFERMSKATVQMCLSTTGFGNPTGGDPDKPCLGNSSGHTIQRSASLDSSSAYKSIVEAQNLSPAPSQTWTPQTTQAPSSRPQPTLDMNFTSASFHGDHNNHSPHMSHHHDQTSYPITTSGPPHSGFIKDEQPPSPPYQYHFGDYNGGNLKQAIQSPSSGYDSPGSVSSFRQTPSSITQPLPHPQPSYYYVHTPQSTTPLSATSVSAPTSAHTFNRDQEPLPPHELDYLNLVPGQGPSQTLSHAPDGSIDSNNSCNGNGNGNGNGTEAIQMVPPTTTVNFGGLAVPPSVGVGAPAIELGFGMGVDLQQQHDWSEGLGYDLFDGYFFGASGGGPVNF